MEAERRITPERGPPVVVSPGASSCLAFPHQLLKEEGAVDPCKDLEGFSLTHCLGWAMSDPFICLLDSGAHIWEKGLHRVGKGEGYSLLGREKHKH